MPDDVDGQTTPERGLSSVLGPRLAVCPPAGPVPTWDELGLVAGRDAAFEWQEIRNPVRVRFSAMSWIVGDGKWIEEIHGLFGIAAELILVCIEAEVEAEMHRLLQGEDLERGRRAWSPRALRFFLEGQANNLVVFGHTVANLTIRTLASYGTWNDSMLKGTGIKSSVFDPRSQDRNAWASLNDPTVTKMVEAAPTLGPEAEALVACLKELSAEGSPWANLYDFRGSQYHRWRTESPGVAATDRSARSVDEILRAGEVVGFPGPDLPFTEGFDVIDELSVAGVGAYKQVVAWMPQFLEAWGKSIEEARPEPEDPPGWPF